MKITDIKATTVTVPLEAPLRHANGCHWGRFVRTIVEVETDEGITGLGEMGGGGEIGRGDFPRDEVVPRRPRPGAHGGDALPHRQPTASLYNNRTQVLAALEFACLDILGKKWNAPVYDILGGKLQDRVPFASYLFFRYPGPDGKARCARSIRWSRT
jgi:glucarate dehydratase